ncbi:MbtH family NRPS accessory protein [Micromonospora sp. b486]|nr:MULTISPECIES: MbtH family NRPS accessory protein [unclassified Micromonospora]MBU8858608.1 MbtH family NRPS accessory protein [Micromonospora sp. WMMB482]MDM4784252.1 MbtH family NRPS accessory protein [Micromonospora sp. b486]
MPVEDTAEFVVVCNNDEQYSIWRADVPVPEGWRPVGGPDSRSDCLRDIAERWTDMRPLSLRRATGEAP